MSPKKLTLSVLLLSAGLAAHAYEKDKTYHFTVLHSNDTHGRFWKNDKGEYGFSVLKTAIDNVRKEVEAQGGTVILLHAGDFNTGVPESDLQNAKPDIEGLNAMKFDALALGNHEFDNPLQLLNKQERWAKFPFLSANVRYKNGKYLVKPYTIIKRGGLKFAVVGLTTEDTAKLGNPEYLGNVTFQPVIEAARDILPQVNKAQPDVRIALTHIGYYNNGKHGHSAPGDVTLARSLPAKSFDMIIGGHSHTPVCINEDGSLKTPYVPNTPCRPDVQNGTPIMQAYEWGKFLGRADFEFKNGETKLVSYQLIPSNLKRKDGSFYTSEIPADPKLQAHLKKYQDEGDRKLNIKVGETTAAFDGTRELVRSQQMPIGQLINRAQLERTQADFSLMQGGGIRDTIPAGTITYKTVLKVQPFGNLLSVVPLSGKETFDYLQEIVFKDKGSGGYPHLAGVTLTYCPASKTIANVKIKGKPLDPNQTYRFVLPDYIAAGGDGYPVLKNHTGFTKTGFVDADTTKVYFSKHSPVNPADYSPDGLLVEQCPAQ